MAGAVTKMQRHPRLKRSELARKMVEDPSIETLDEVAPLPRPSNRLVHGSPQALALVDTMRPARYALLAIASDVLAVESGVLDGRFDEQYAPEDALFDDLGRGFLGSQSDVADQALHELSGRVSEPMREAWSATRDQIRDSVFAPHYQRLCEITRLSVFYGSPAEGLTLDQLNGDVLVDLGVKTGIANHVARTLALVTFAHRLSKNPDIELNAVQLARQNPHMLMRMTSIPFDGLAAVVSGLRDPHTDITGPYFFNPDEIDVDIRGPKRVRLDWANPMSSHYANVKITSGIDRCPMATDLEGETSKWVHEDRSDEAHDLVAGNLVKGYIDTVLSEADVFFDALPAGNVWSYRFVEPDLSRPADDSAGDLSAARFPF